MGVNEKTQTETLNSTNDPIAQYIGINDGNFEFWMVPQYSSACGDRAVQECPARPIDCCVGHRSKLNEQASGSNKRRFVEEPKLGAPDRGWLVGCAESKIITNAGRARGQA
jgi:hypothetical protein